VRAARTEAARTRPGTDPARARARAGGTAHHPPQAGRRAVDLARGG
jgi:hypothetical protein